MKKDIHPKTNYVTFKYKNDKKLRVKTTLGKKDEELVILLGDWPPESHPAWNRSQQVGIKSTTNISKFTDKFGGDLFEF